MAVLSAMFYLVITITKAFAYNGAVKPAVPGLLIPTGPLIKCGCGIAAIAGLVHLSSSLDRDDEVPEGLAPEEFTIAPPTQSGAPGDNKQEATLDDASMITGLYARAKQLEEERQQKERPKTSEKNT